MKRQWKEVHAAGNLVWKNINHLAHQHPVALNCIGNNSWVRGSAAGIGVRNSTDEYTGTALHRLQTFLDAHPNEWIFGHLGYNLKSETENIRCDHPTENDFSDLYFFVPDIVILYDAQSIRIGGFSHQVIDDVVRALEHTNAQPGTTNEILLSGTTSADEYRERCNALLKHIHRGDIYEVNYCIDFVGHASQFNAVAVFGKLFELSDAPFSTFYRNNDNWLMCASPERFLSKQGARLISQPIKGTRRRSADPRTDDALKTELQNDQKERSENVMIVDLVRNDLSRVAKRSSVHVPELFGIHTFKTVHQMISTVACELRADVKFSDIIRATFPMGSMTGAPKISAMKLAEKHEQQSRGLYSGSVGYIDPKGNFDFNVVIRSITWNAATGHISAKAGSAITAKSDPEKEFEECLLKAQAMMNALHTSGTEPFKG